ncbi:Dual specificity phosphatase, catalytic domain protein [Niveomyces insectorum RCEF 264]|uniref:Dual specificity phosphatase, catalytic domain protein n=1 Tax=Niveomyces insectorum RCEF 264 TaxID=1081102 RepID=A0A167QYL3_9HYPO|nr:Dual specificity phosphatase, catalytic domain protein [Niveomyces insectorum RCEF 264]
MDFGGDSAASAPRMPRAPGVVANAEYSSRSPQPPSIPIPMGMQYVQGTVSYSRRGPPLWPRPPSPPPRADAAAPLNAPPYSAANPSGIKTIWPSQHHAAVLGLTAAQLRAITDGQPEMVHRDIGGWLYDMRRSAQRILRFLYLGPASAARDKDFLRREGITLLLAARDARFAQTRLLSTESTAQEVGIAAANIDVSSNEALVRVLPDAIRIINNHLLTQVGRPGPHGGGGKVLVFCETGNDRSAAVVVAYVLSMYHLTLVEALQFVCNRRFCLSINEGTKRMLLSYSEILAAQTDVARQQADAVALQEGNNQVLAANHADGSTRSNVNVNINVNINNNNNNNNNDNSEDAVMEQANDTADDAALFRSHSNRRSKRRIGDTMETDDNPADTDSSATVSPAAEEPAVPGSSNYDMARYQDRGHFAPFTDTGHTQTPP